MTATPFRTVGVDCISNRRYFSLTAALFLLCGFFLPAPAHASTTVDYFVTSGTDTVSGVTIPFITLDVTRVDASDNNRKKSAVGWPSAGAYDENKYLEFVFTPSVPSNVIISSVVITHEWRNTNSTSVGFARLEVWDGSAFTNFPVTASVGTSEITTVTDIFSVVDTAAKVNALKVRFLAYRNTFATLAETSHDLFKITVVYDLPADQTITFDDILGKTYGDLPFELTATSTSGLPVAFTVTSGPATLEGSTLSIIGAGTVTVRAAQAGSGSYNAATFVEKIFTVGKASAAITLGNLGHAYDGTATSATATSTPSGLSSILLTYNGTTTPPTEAGSYAVVATLDNPNYAGSATSTLVIHSVVSPSPSAAAGTYSTIQNITLTATSSDSIRYTTDGSTPSCESGTMYSSVIAIAKTKTITAISCYSIGVSGSVSEFSYVINLKIPPGDLGAAIANGIFSVPFGAATSSTPSITLAEELAVTVSEGSSSHSVTLPRGVLITRTSGGSLDAGALTASVPDAGSITGLASGKTLRAALQWGIAGQGLEFSTPISLEIVVGTDHNGEVFDIERSVTGADGWTSEGIVVPTCTIVNGACTFQATKASYYAVTHLPAAAAAIQSSSVAEVATIPSGYRSGGGQTSVKATSRPAADIAAGCSMSQRNLSQGDQNSTSGNVCIGTFNLLMIHWGTSSTSATTEADLNNDSRVDLLDFNALMIRWSSL